MTSVNMYATEVLVLLLLFCLVLLLFLLFVLILFLLLLLLFWEVFVLFIHLGPSRVPPCWFALYQ